MDFLFNILMALGTMIVLGALTGICCGFFSPRPEEERASATASEKASEFRAFVKCAGGNNSERRYTFSDSQDCAAADMLYGGMTECRHSCLGLGSCVSFCKNHAISIKSGVAVVEPSLCDGCGECIDVCPRAVIELVPKKAEIMVACTSTEKGFELDKICDVGCIGCTLCVNTCQYDAIKIKDNVAVIDYESCTDCGACAEACPRGIISAPPKEEEPEEFDENEYFEISEALEESEK